MSNSPLSCPSLRYFPNVAIWSRPRARSFIIPSILDVNCDPHLSFSLPEKNGGETRERKRDRERYIHTHDRQTGRQTDRQIHTNDRQPGRPTEPTRARERRAGTQRDRETARERGKEERERERGRGRGAEGGTEGVRKGGREEERGREEAIERTGERFGGETLPVLNLGGMCAWTKLWSIARPGASRSDHTE